ncbi:MAG: ATP-binding protein [Bacilli bacterium]|nr:ATP-binding protein [Bacilli bacterium]
MIKFYFQLLIPVALMFCRFPRRRLFWLRLSLSLGITLIISTLFTGPELLSFLTPFFQYLLFYLIAYAFTLIQVFLCFDLPLPNAFFFAVESFVVQNFCHHLFVLIMRSFGVVPGTEYDKFGYLALLGGIYLVTYLIFFYLVDKLKLRHANKIPNSSILVESAFFLVMIFLWVYIRHNRGELFNEIAIAIGYELYSTVLALLMLLMLMGIFNIGKLQESNEQLEERIILEGEYYHTAKKNADEIGAICHNLKHQIAALKAMDNVEEKGEIIDNLEKSVEFYGSIGKTGNPALDCVLTEAGMSCAKHEITLSVIADGSLIQRIKFNDVYSLFGNIIENAIESNLKCSNKSKRYIDLKIFERGGMCYVHVENWCLKELVIDGEIPKTSKSGKGHGYGIKSIIFLVEKYGGNARIEAKNGTFSLDILLPLEDK